MFPQTVRFTEPTATIILGILAISCMGGKGQCCAEFSSTENTDAVELGSESLEKSQRPGNV